MVADASARPAGPETPTGVNHIVLNVRDLEESHRFWTEVIGLKQVGELKPRPDRPTPPKMRFYSGLRGGRLNHHDIALMENPKVPAPPPGGWEAAEGAPAVNHIAITLPDRESWLRQLAWVKSRGVAFDRRIDHGMTHSLYIRDPNGYGVEILYELPREVWEGDIDGALNYIDVRPTEGAEALTDRTDVPRFG